MPFIFTLKFCSIFKQINSKPGNPRNLSPHVFVNSTICCLQVKGCVLVRR